MFKAVRFPLLIGFIAVLACWRLGFGLDLSQRSDALAFAGTLASVGTTMLGFMAAALAIIASISHTHLVSMMRKTGHYKELLASLFAGCVFFLAIAVSGFGLLYGAPISSTTVWALVGLHVAALISVWDIGVKFWFVLRNLNPDN